MADDDSGGPEAPVRGCRSRHQLACPLGAACGQTALLHFADFSHTITWGVQTEATSSTLPAESAATGAAAPPSVGLKRQDTVPIDDFLAAAGSAKRRCTEEDPRKVAEAVTADDDDSVEKKPLSRGLSLMRQFSAMTHAERKALVAEAIAARLSLERRLQCLADRLSCGGLPAMPEERAAIEAGEFLVLPLRAASHYWAGTAQEIHYRIAEAQFHRLLARDCVGCFQVTQVDYVVNPKLLKEFRDFQASLTEAAADLPESECHHPVLAFHGTDEGSIESICRDGFRAPGASADYCQASDTGWYGRGIYFSEFPACAMDYVKGRSRLLLCMVLPGRSHRCPRLCHHGQPCQPGHHSHRSPDGRELVVFSPHQALPTYVVHFERSAPAPPAEAAAADKLEGPHDALHSLYFRASGLATRLLAGRTVWVDPEGLDGSTPGLLVTRDQVARFCTAQGAARVVEAVPEDGEDGGRASCLSVRLHSSPVSESEGDRQECSGSVVWSVSELLRKALEAGVVAEAGDSNHGGSNS